MKISKVALSDKTVSSKISQDVSTCLNTVLSGIKSANLSRSSVAFFSRARSIDELAWIRLEQYVKENLYDCNVYADFVARALKELETIKPILYTGFHFLSFHVHNSAFDEIKNHIESTETSTREELESAIAVFYVFLLVPLYILQKATKNIDGGYTSLRLFHNKENNLGNTIRQIKSEISKYYSLLRYLNVDNYKLFDIYVLYFISVCYIDNILDQAEKFMGLNKTKSTENIMHKIYSALLEAEDSFIFTNIENTFMRIKKMSILYLLLRSIEASSLKFLEKIEALSSDEERIRFIEETSFAFYPRCAPLLYFLCFDNEAREMWNNLIDEHSYLRTYAKNKRGIIQKLNNAYKFMLKNNVFPNGIDMHTF